MDKEVVLSNVGRNLNRAYRTCEAFGVKRMLLHNCKGSLKGNLFKSKGRVDMLNIDTLDLDNAAYFEVDGGVDVKDFDFSSIKYLVFGGETLSLPRKYKKNRVRIPTYGNVSGLTVEAAVAIALFHIKNLE